MSPETTPLGRCGSYELLIELAAGGMATVYLARAVDGRDAPLVAIKRPHRHLSKEKAYLTMLVDEARLASSIDHENVVHVRELGFDGGQPFMALDYVEGAALSDVRKDLSTLGRALDPRVALCIALDCLAGLHAAHELGIIHRDVSPHNILLGLDGKASVTDFGIAQAADRVQTTRTHEVKGKLAYLAPERIDRRRTCTAQSDVFALAIVLWESIAGRRLFRGDQPAQTLQDVMTAPIPSLKKLGAPVSDPLDAVVLRGLARDLPTRYKTAEEFATALRQSGAPVATRSEVGAVVQTLYGDRLRARHSELREVVSDPSLLTELPEHTDLASLDDVAPPAPSQRYLVIAEPPFHSRANLVRSKILRITPATFFKLGAALGGATLALATGWLVLAMRDEPAAGPVFPPAPSIVIAPAPAISTRHVVIPLPFVATKATFDEQSQTIAPAADVVAFDIPRGSGLRHRVTALGADGSKAEAFVREQDGVAEAEGDGFTVDEPSQKEELSQKPRKRKARPLAVPPPRPVGSDKDGFTKLQ